MNIKYIKLVLKENIDFAGQFSNYSPYIWGWRGHFNRVIIRYAHLRSVHLVTRHSRVCNMTWHACKLVPATHHTGIAYFIDIGLGSCVVTSRINRSIVVAISGIHIRIGPPKINKKYNKIEKCNWTTLLF